MPVSFPDSLTHLDSGSRVSAVSGHSQLQGAAVFKALVQGGFEVYPDGVRVVLLGLGLVAAHHLGAGGGGADRVRFGAHTPPWATERGVRV